MKTSSLLALIPAVALAGAPPAKAPTAPAPAGNKLTSGGMIVKKAPPSAVKAQAPQSAKPQK